MKRRPTGSVLTCVHSSAACSSLQGPLGRKQDADGSLGRTGVHSSLGLTQDQEDQSASPVQARGASLTQTERPKLLTPKTLVGQKSTFPWLPRSLRSYVLPYTHHGHPALTRTPRRRRCNHALQHLSSKLLFSETDDQGEEDST